MKSKILLTLALTFSFIVPFITINSNFNSRKGFNEQAEFQISEIEKDLKQNSKTVGSEFVYKYKGDEYRDKNSILSQELKKNPILQETTASNPNKIIKNYSTNELDSGKIYNLDSMNFVKVYKNALGKTVLPTCLPGQTKGCYKDPNNGDTKSIEDRALDSYVNRGLIRPKYSYDSVDWYDSEFEARGAFKKNNFTIKQSLFYYYKGLYYNAFNPDDMKAIQDKMEPGFYYDAFKTRIDSDGLMYEIEKGPLEGNMGDENGPSPLEKSFQFKEEDFKEYFYNNFWAYFSKNIDSFISNTFNYSINLTAPEGQWFEIIEDNYDGIELQLSNYKKNLKISINNFARAEIELETILENLKESGKWESYLLWDKKACIFGDKKRRWHNFEFNNSIHNKKNFKIRLDTENGPECERGFNDTNPENIIVSENGIDQSNYNFQFRENLFLNELNKFYEIKSKEKQNVIFDINSILKNFATSSGKDRQKILKEIASLTNLRNFNPSYQKILFNRIYEMLEKNLYENKLKTSPIRKDWMYGKIHSNKEYDFSFHESQLDFQKKELRPIESKKGNVTIDLKNINFTTTYDNWKNKFYFLDNDENNNGVILKRMYYVDNNKNDDITTFSDQLKENLASNPNAAKEIMFQNSQQILRKGYEVYDINGRMFFSRKSEKDVILELKKQIELNYKYIHRDEAAILKDQENGWDNLISTGRYTIFKFKLNTNKWVYFKDYQSALELYKNNLSLINSISEEFIIYKVYSTIINNELIVYEWNSKTNTKLLAEKIYNDLITKGEI